MSLIIARNFKREKALDSIASDANFKVGDTVRVDASYSRNVNNGIGKVVKVDGSSDIVVEFAGHGTVRVPVPYATLVNSRAADACGTDANFKKGDKVTVKTKWAGTRKGIVKEVINDPALKKAYVVEIEGAETAAYPAEIVSADACEDSAELRVVHAKGVGKWWVEPNLSRFNDADREQTHKGRKEFPDREAAIKYARGTGKTFIVNDACEDSAAKFRIGQEVIVKTKYAKPYKAHIVGLWDMSQNGPYNEQGYLIKNLKGGGVESMPEHALSLVTAKDSAELNNDADLRAALSKMADIAKRLTDAKVSFKAGWTPDGIGEIILEFPNIESARKYNYYKLFNAWEAARSQIVPHWAVNIGGYRVPRIEGNRMTISILHFST